MVKSKACKICRTIFVDGSICPECGSNQNTDNYKGKILVLDAQKSEIAKNLKLEKNGEFAIKVR